MSEQEKKRARGLGRGLSALMSDISVEPEGSGPPPRADRMLGVDQIAPNPDQPRSRFAPEQLQELSESIREKGVIQPLIVRPFEGAYQIVAGERRWRAAQMARLHEVPVIIREMDDTEVLEIAIIENIQRADLNPIEEGQGYQALIDRFGHTQDKLSKALGKSRSHIANMIRLGGLPDEVKAFVAEGKLSMGHARALVPLDADVAVQKAQQVVTQGLSVRQLENALKTPGSGTSRGASRSSARKGEKDADTRALEGDLSAQLRMKVDIQHSGTSGSVTIRYDDLDQLDLLCSLLSAGHPAGSI